MADFESQIEDIAGTIPATADGEQFLKDGIWDIIKRIESINPQKLMLFSSSTNISDSQGARALSDNIIMHVTRNSVNCRMVKNSMIPSVVDTSSLFYSTDTDPVFYISNGTLYIKPDPSAEATGIVNKVDIGTITNWNTGTSSISNFPSSMYKNVILFAALRVLNERIRGYSLSTIGSMPVEPSEPSFSSVSSTLPPISITSMDTFPTFGLSSSDVVFTNIPDQPTFTSPVFQITTAPTITDLDLSSISVPTAVLISSSSISSGDLVIPIYTKPEVTYDTTQFETFLETNEDPELAGLQLGRLQKEVSNYQADIQNELNKFNEELVLYQGVLARVTKDAELESASVSQEVQNYQAEISSYGAQVNASIQEHVVNEIQKEMGIWAKSVERDISVYNTDIQNEVSRVQADIANYKAFVDKAIATYQAENNVDMQLYSVEAKGVIDEYGALLQGAIATFTQELEAYKLDNLTVSARNSELLNKYQVASTIYNSDLMKTLQEYNADIQKDTVAIQLLESSYNKVKMEYEQAFAPFQKEK